MVPKSWEFRFTSPLIACRVHNIKRILYWSGVLSMMICLTSFSCAELRSVCSPSFLIGMEATGHYWLSLYSFLTEEGYNVKVISTFLESYGHYQKVDYACFKLGVGTRADRYPLPGFTMNHRVYTVVLTRPDFH